MRVIPFLPTLAALCLSCASSHQEPQTPEIGATAEATVGPTGGSLTLAGLHLTVPAGSLDQQTTISVTAGAADDTPFTHYSPVFRFEPSGLRFKVPARIELPFDGKKNAATIFWSTEDGKFAARPTVVENGKAITTVEHFSQAFVGTACDGDDCCSRGTNQLDVLFMVDNSNSMAEEQAALAARFPEIVRAIGSGDVDGDGLQDFPVAESVHVGIVSSDMGAGGNADIPTCSEAPDFGDDGVLRSTGNTTLMGCEETYPSVLTYDRATGDADQLAHDFACVAHLGIGGCGFEQQLEASLKALQPSTCTESWCEFRTGTRGHGDRENTGLLRDDSVLAIIDVTDEDDCSSMTDGLFDARSTTYIGDLNLRCTRYESSLFTPDRYVDGFLSLRADPNRLLYAAITGVPTDMSSTAMDYSAILDDPRMQIQEGTTTEDRPHLVPACGTTSGLAYPARRIVTVAQGIAASGGSSIVDSICSDDFQESTSHIIQAISQRLAGSCGG